MAFQYIFSSKKNLWRNYQLSHMGSPRILEWVAYPFSSGSSRPRNWTKVSCIAGGFFTSWAIREATSRSWTLNTRIFQNNCHVGKKKLENDCVRPEKGSEKTWIGTETPHNNQKQNQNKRGVNLIFQSYHIVRFHVSIPQKSHKAYKETEKESMAHIMER